MRVVFVVVLLTGVGLAGGAVYMAQDYISQYRAALAQERAANERSVPLTEVFVADKALAYGTELTPDTVRRVAWPKSALPEGAFADAAALFPEDADGPREVLRAMEKNEPVLAVKITAPGQAAGITSRLSEGNRAFTVRVDAATGVSGFLRPGDRVDVYWTGSSGQREVTKLIDTGVRIVAIDQSADADRPKAQVARTVTVETSPQQVAALAQAQSTGRLSLSLVGATDTTVAEAVEVDQNRLLGIEERAQVTGPAPEKKVCTITTRRGSEVTEIPIPCTN